MTPTSSVFLIEATTSGEALTSTKLRIVQGACSTEAEVKRVKAE